MTTPIPKPPSHLEPASKKWFRAVTTEYELSEADVRLLVVACECWDQAMKARKAVADEGMFVVNRFGEKKAHPGVMIARDARIGFMRALRELNLDGSPEPDVRPPRIAGR